MIQGTESKSGGEDAAAELERATEQKASIDSMPAAEPQTPAGEKVAQAPSRSRSRLKIAVSSLVAGLSFLGAMRGAEADYTVLQPQPKGRHEIVSTVKLDGLKRTVKERQQDVLDIGSLLENYAIKYKEIQNNKGDTSTLKPGVTNAIARAKALAGELRIKTESLFDTSIAKELGIDIEKVAPTSEPVRPVGPPETKAAGSIKKVPDSDKPDGKTRVATKSPTPHGIHPDLVKDPFGSEDPEKSPK
ncbi:MAG: hypothetical protein HQ530_01755 [Parcubacteria group bacterium]|nr:hypothetical protein [Parcubacteria group bacterium]